MGRRIELTMDMDEAYGEDGLDAAQGLLNTLACKDDGIWSHEHWGVTVSVSMNFYPKTEESGSQEGGA